MHLRLGADLEVHVLGGALGVVGSLGARLDVRGDAVVVRGREEVEVVETLEGDGVLGRAEADGGSVASDLALGDVVGRLRTEQEAVAANHGVRGESGALERRRVSTRTREDATKYRHLEEVKEGAGVEAGLLVGGSDERALAGAVGGERGVQVELEALGKVVLGLDLGLDEVVGGPALGEDEAARLVGVLGLELAVNGTSLFLLLARNLEGDVGGGDGLNLEAVTGEVVVPAQQVVGGLAEILRVANIAF